MGQIKYNLIENWNEVAYLGQWLMDSFTLVVLIFIPNYPTSNLAVHSEG